MNFAEILHLSNLTSCAGGWKFEFQRPAKFCTALQAFRHHFNIYTGSCFALVLLCGDGHRKLVTHFGVIRQV